jgi:cobalamin biosynthesis protein CobD/CbiB
LLVQFMSEIRKINPSCQYLGHKSYWAWEAHHRITERKGNTQRVRGWAVIIVFMLLLLWLLVSLNTYLKQALYWALYMVCLLTHTHTHTHTHTVHKPVEFIL